MNGGNRVLLGIPDERDSIAGRYCPPRDGLTIRTDLLRFLLPSGVSKGFGVMYDAFERLTADR